jgi:hypothetical protein
MPPSHICPHTRGFQTIENDLILTTKMGKIEKGGFCMIWSIFFAEMTLSNPQFSSKEIFDYIFNKINNNALKTKTIIRGYLEIIYDRIINIIQNMYKVKFKLGKLPTYNEIDKIISTKNFKKKHENIVNEKFKIYNNTDITSFFNDVANFQSLSPSQINPKYRRGMLDSP